jgi:WD40 repeat protein
MQLRLPGCGVDDPTNLAFFFFFFFCSCYFFYGWLIKNGLTRLSYSTTLQKKKKSNKSASQPQSRLVAVGTSNGDILIYSLTHGNLQTTLSSGSPTPITDFTFSARDSYAVGYSVSASGELIKWDLLKGSVLSKLRADTNSLSKVVVDPSGNVMVAGTSLRLFGGSSLSGVGSSARPLKEFMGHATSVVALKFTSNAGLCVSAASQDRFVSVWNCDTKDTQASNVTGK